MIEELTSISSAMMPGKPFEVRLEKLIHLLNRLCASATASQ